MKIKQNKRQPITWMTIQKTFQKASIRKLLSKGLSRRRARGGLLLGTALGLGDGVGLTLNINKYGVGGKSGYQ